jgi:hypothetical protein
MSIDEPIDSTYEQHRIIFADRLRLTPNDNDKDLKQQWLEIYHETINEGAVKSNGRIAWDCPCLGTQSIGPCSRQFRRAFACYQYSSNIPKGNRFMFSPISTI